ncbi:hypothetical protein JB92DRAFT_2824343 [Gautieria morchelliformis]|nr:hypothetical protein JB92DRAFT_2824343 [Gautieria morchelliformis]
MKGSGRAARGGVACATPRGLGSLGPGVLSRPDVQDVGARRGVAAVPAGSCESARMSSSTGGWGWYPFSLEFNVQPRASRFLRVQLTRRRTMLVRQAFATGTQIGSLTNASIYGPYSPTGLRSESNFTSVRVVSAEPVHRLLFSLTVVSDQLFPIYILKAVARTPACGTVRRTVIPPCMAGSSGFEKHTAGVGI